jgi:hypothetical protein
VPDSASAAGVDIVYRSWTESSLTPRWRELDSNLRFRARAVSVLPLRDQMLASSCSSGEPGEVPFHRQVTSESLPITRIAPAEGHLRRTHHHPAIDGHRSLRVVRKDRTKDIDLSWANITTGWRTVCRNLQTGIWRRKRCLIGTARNRPLCRLRGKIDDRAVQAFVETHLPGGRIMVIDQRPGVVEHHLLRHPVKAPEGALQPVEPGRLPLVPKGSDKRTWGRGRSTVSSGKLSPQCR